MTNTEIVKKIIGEINPVGESHLDEYRFGNLKLMCELANDLFIMINDVAKHKDRDEYSMKKAGRYAEDFLTEIATHYHKGPF